MEGSGYYNQSSIQPLKEKKETRTFSHFSFLVLPSPIRGSVGSVAHLRTGGRWFDPRHGQYSFRVMMSHCDRTHSSPATARCFDSGYVGKEPVVWTEYCAEYWIKELQESRDSCTGRCDITEILLKIALNPIQLIKSCWSE